MLKPKNVDEDLKKLGTYKNYKISRNFRIKFVIETLKNFDYQIFYCSKILKRVCADIQRESFTHWRSTLDARIANSSRESKFMMHT